MMPTRCRETGETTSTRGKSRSRTRSFRVELFRRVCCFTRAVTIHWIDNQFKILMLVRFWFQCRFLFKPLWNIGMVAGCSFAIFLSFFSGFCHSSTPEAKPTACYWSGFALWIRSWVTSTASTAQQTGRRHVETLTVLRNRIISILKRNKAIICAMC